MIKYSLNCLTTKRLWTNIHIRFFSLIREYPSTRILAAALVFKDPAVSWGNMTDRVIIRY